MLREELLLFTLFMLFFDEQLDTEHNDYQFYFDFELTDFFIEPTFLPLSMFLESVPFALVTGLVLLSSYPKVQTCYFDLLDFCEALLFLDDFIYLFSYKLD